MNNLCINIGIFIVIIVVVLVWFLLNKIMFGFEICLVGLNLNVSEYVGMFVKCIIILLMIIFGVFVGFGGVVEGLGIFENVFV